LAAVPSLGRASLVERSRFAPQAAATEGLYERHAAKLQSYCQHQLGSREEAEDAVQTTYMNAFRALGRGVVPEAESAWLFKIAENVCLSRRRSSWRRGRIESPSDFEIIELIGIEDALASMPEQQRRAILLREWQGLSYREIAEELELTQSAVETLIFRARRSLAQGLEQPDSVKKPKRKSFRRALHTFDVGTLAAAVKTCSQAARPSKRPQAPSH
jgi:RNA polymerase sigma factor (sigma-70 family)